MKNKSTIKFEYDFFDDNGHHIIVTEILLLNCSDGNQYFAIRRTGCWAYTEHFASKISGHPKEIVFLGKIYSKEEYFSDEFHKFLYSEEIQQQLHNLAIADVMQRYEKYEMKEETYSEDDIFELRVNDWDVYEAGLFKELFDI